MLYTKMQTQSFLGYGEYFLNILLPSMGMAVILFNGGAIRINCQYLLDRRLHVKSGENWSSGFIEEVV